MTAAEFIKVRHPQDYDDIPQWHIDDLEAYAAQQKPPSSATAEEHGTDLATSLDEARFHVTPWP